MTQLKNLFYVAVAEWLRKQESVKKSVDEVVYVKDDSGMEYESFGSSYHHCVCIAYTSGGKMEYYYWYGTLHEILQQLLEIDVD